MSGTHLGLFGGNFSTLLTLKACAYASLAGIAGERIAEAGHLVLTAVDEAKRTKPALFRVKRKRSGPVGDGSEYWDLLGDFEIAQVLFPDDDIALALKHKIPLIPAYVAVVCVSGNPSQSWIDSALDYLVSRLQFRQEFLTNWAAAIKNQLDEIKPLAETGRKFAGGRKLNSEGPLSKAVAAHLNRNPDDNPEQVWAALANNPPKGMSFMNSVSLGRYIEYDKRTHKGELKDTGFRRFANIVYRKRKLALQLH